MPTEFTVTHQVQEDPVDGLNKVPVLPSPRVVIIYSNDAVDFVKEVTDVLADTYQVVGHNVAIPASDVALFQDIRSSWKVLLVISMEMMDIGKQRKQTIRELRVVEDLISERHMECLVPVYQGIKPDSEDIPETMQYSCALPAGHAADYIKAEDKNFDLIKSKISGPSPIASFGSHGAAYGIAWSYFYGWLYVVLQELRERMIQAARETRVDWNIERNFELYPKLIVIIPRNGFSVTNLSAYDPTVQPVASKTEQTSDGFPTQIKVKYTKAVVGQIKRDFSTPLFKTSHRSKTYVFAAEVPTCLKTLNDMADPDSDYVPDFNVIDHHRELHVFMGQLNRILNIKTKTDKFAHIRRQTVRILYFDDEHDSLSEVIANAIEEDLKWQSSPNPWATADLKAALPAN